jgi:hypothetical protein
MNDSIDQNEEVEAAVEQAVANFASEIENIFGNVDPTAWLPGEAQRRKRKW